LEGGVKLGGMNTGSVETSEERFSSTRKRAVRGDKGWEARRFGIKKSLGKISEVSKLASWKQHECDATGGG